MPVPYADLSDPQSLNQYSYVRNLPTVKMDADGHDGVLELMEKAATYAGTGLAQLVDSGTAEGAEMISEVGGAESVSGASRWGLLAGPALYLSAMIHPATVGGPEADRPSQTRQNGGDPQQEPQQEPEPATASGGARQGAGKKGGENADAALGREKHAEFSEKAKAKGWQTEPRLTDPKTGKQVKPDAVTRTGRPVELKPRTASGKAAGKQQLKKYERATGKKGRVIYYGKSTN